MSCDTPAAPRPRRPFELTGWMVAGILVLFFGVIISVNATILTVALRTMPGVETRSAYEDSQHFNEEIARQHERDARGWKAAVTLARQGEGASLGIALTDRMGQPLSGFTTTARLRHPATSARDHSIALNERQPGRYEANVEPVEPGSWILELRARRGEEVVFISRSRVNLPEM